MKPWKISGLFGNLSIMKIANFYKPMQDSTHWYVHCTVQYMCSTVQYSSVSHCLSIVLYRVQYRWFRQSRRPSHFMWGQLQKGLSWGSLGPPVWSPLFLTAPSLRVLRCPPVPGQTSSAWPSQGGNLLLLAAGWCSGWARGRREQIGSCDQQG